MNKRDALKIKPGQRIVCGDNTWREEDWFEGDVIHVTPNGGIRLRTSTGGDAWVPYHRVRRVKALASKPTNLSNVKTTDDLWA